MPKSPTARTLFIERMKREGKCEEWRRRYKEAKKDVTPENWKAASDKVMEEMGFLGKLVEREIHERFLKFGMAGIPEQIEAAQAQLDQNDLIKVLGDYAWYDKNTCHVGEMYTHQVGLKKPNAFGLYDMHGNVDEWCHDYFERDYYKQSPAKDPTGPTSGSFRVLRGGPWFFSTRFTRSADRDRNGAGYRSFIIGFRLVRELD